MEAPGKVRRSRVTARTRKARLESSGILSKAGHEESCLKQRDHSARLNTWMETDRNQYREGKVKSTPNSGVKEPETVRLQAVGATGGDGVPLDNEPTSCFSAARLSTVRCGAEAKASLTYGA